MSSRFRTVCLSDPRFERDGLRHVTVKSDALRGRGDVTVWAPTDRPPQALLVLLHGVYGSHWSWALQGGAHRTAAHLVESGQIPPMAIAMPSDGLRGDGSGYLRLADQVDVERWIVEDVPEAARLACEAHPPEASTWPVAIAGLSMGGFGALRIGARHPARYCAIAGHSSITEGAQLADFIEEDVATLHPDAARERVADALIQAGPHLPPLRFDCGRDDALVDANRALHDALDAARVRHAYEEFDGGHTWAYWETHLADTLRFVGDVIGRRSSLGPSGTAARSAAAP